LSDEINDDVRRAFKRAEGVRAKLDYMELCVRARDGSCSLEVLTHEKKFVRDGITIVELWPVTRLKQALAGEINQAIDRVLGVRIDRLVNDIAKKGATG